jgi:hypothetical protein
MRRLVLLAGVTGACRFDHGTASIGDAVTSSDGNGEDAEVLDVGLDVAPQAVCDPTDPTLRACYTFETNTLDSSGKDNHITTTSNAFAMGRSGMGLVTAAGTFTVAATTTLDVNPLSIKVWIMPFALPTGGARMGLVDSGSRWRLFVQSDGAVRCRLSTGPDLTSAIGKVTANTWQRVTCTYDGAQMLIYVDGMLVATQTQTASFPATGSGMVVGHNNPTGENFDGVIDELQIFSAIVAP